MKEHRRVLRIWHSLVLVLLTGLLLFVWGCNSDSDDDRSNSAQPSFAGYYFDGAKSAPCVWTGTERTALPGDGTHTAAALSPAVTYNGTVYAAGYYNDGTNNIACYWAGTDRIDLPGDDTHSAYAMSLTVVGGTVYTAGEYYDGTTWVPCYWSGTDEENIARTDLPGDPDDSTHPAMAYSIAVDDGTVYVVGYYYDGAKSIPCGWTDDGDEVDLTEFETPANGATALSITISGGRTFTAGVYNDGSKDVPCVWIGTDLYALAGDGTHDAYATTTAVVNNTVYIGGFYETGTSTMACYWSGTDEENIARTDLDDYAYIFTSTVVDGRVYFGGYSYASQDIIPCFWTRTDRTDLETDSSLQGKVVSAAWWWWD